MLTYTAAYFSLEEGGYECRVVDFPGAKSTATTLRGARKLLQDSLIELAMRTIERGEPLPRPNPTGDPPDAEIVENIYLLLSATCRLPLDGVVPADD